MRSFKITHKAKATKTVSSLTIARRCFDKAINYLGIDLAKDLLIDTRQVAAVKLFVFVMRRSEGFANYLDGGDGRMCQTQSSDTRPNGEQTRSPEPKTPRPEWICQALKPLYILKKKTSTVNPLVTSSTRSGD